MRVRVAVHRPGLLTVIFYVFSDGPHTQSMAIADALSLFTVTALVIGLSALNGGAGGATEFGQPPGGWLMLPGHDVRIAVYYINLNRSTARRQAIEASLSAAGVPAQRLEAIALPEGADVGEVLQRREVARGWCCLGTSCATSEGGPDPWSRVMARKELRGVRTPEGPWMDPLLPTSPRSLHRRCHPVAHPPSREYLHLLVAVLTPPRAAVAPSQAASVAALFARVVAAAYHGRIPGVQPGRDLVLLLEDDVIIDVDFAARMSKAYGALPAEWDLARFAVWGTVNANDHIGAGWYQVGVSGRSTWPGGRSPPMAYLGAAATLMEVGNRTRLLWGLTTRGPLCWHDASWLAFTVKMRKGRSLVYEPGRIPEGAAGPIDDAGWRSHWADEPTTAGQGGAGQAGAAASVCRNDGGPVCLPTPGAGDSGSTIVGEA